MANVNTRVGLLEKLHDKKKRLAVLTRANSEVSLCIAGLLRACEAECGVLRRLVRYVSVAAVWGGYLYALDFILLHWGLCERIIHEIHHAFGGDPKALFEFIRSNILVLENFVLSNIDADIARGMDEHDGDENDGGDEIGGHSEEIGITQLEAEIEKKEDAIGRQEVQLVHRNRRRAHLELLSSSMQWAIIFSVLGPLICLPLVAEYPPLWMTILVWIVTQGWRIVKAVWWMTQ